MKTILSKERWLEFVSWLIKTKFIIRNFYAEHLKIYGRVIYTFSGLLSIVILIAEYGFYYPKSWTEVVRMVVLLLVDFFLFYEVLALVFSSQGFKAYLNTHKLEIVIVVLICIEKFFEQQILNFLKIYHLTGDDATLIFLSTNQILFIFANLAHFFRLTKFYDAKKVNPSLAFVLSFSLIIALGVIFLHFPKAQRMEVPTIDIVFITFSATCVTGLATIDIGQSFTTTGQIIVLLLIQIGGLGLMTLTSFFSIFLAGKASVNDKLLMKDLLSEEALGQVRSLLKQVALQTFFIEAIGSFLLYFSLPVQLYSSEFDHIYLAVFHSISAFCNAGFSLFPAGLANESFQSTYTFLSTIMILIIFGGLGFPVVKQIITRIRKPNDFTFRWSLSSRLVFYSSTFLWVIGFLAYFFLETEFTLYNLTLFDKFFHSLFYSVTTRTAGFNSLELSHMSIPMTFFSLFLMWVGASPVSTAGGIKTTTLAIAFLNIVNQIRGKQHLSINNRFVAPSSISRASATIVLSLFVIFVAIFGLVINESFSFLDISFEVVSAFGTVGLSRGITSELSTNSKLILCGVMFGGRVGILTFLIALSKKAQNYNIIYPEEYVVVG